MYKYAEYLVATIESMSVRETKNQKQIALNVICIADVFSAITIPEEKKLINDPTPPEIFNKGETSFNNFGRREGDRRYDNQIKVNVSCT